MYKYKQVVPFEYKRYVKLKNVVFSDEVRNQMDTFFEYISLLCKEDYLNHKGKLDKEKRILLIEDLSVRYKELRHKYIKPLVEKQYKYKDLLYTQEEVDFIFICSYYLIDKFDMSQRMLAKVFGIKENKFSKLGCFPIRCHDAYTKLDNISKRKCLVPDNFNSRGIQIAEYINKNIQAIYACSAFIGISNDLDTLVNISTTDTKAFVFTKPTDNNDIVKFLLSYPRFLFASGNNFENTAEAYKAGKIKEKIIDLLKMRDDELLKYSNYLREVLADGEDYRKYCIDTQSTGFKNNLKKYRGQVELLQEIEKGEYYFEDIIYDDEYRKMIGIRAYEINFDLEDEDALCDYLNESKEKTYTNLLNFMSYAKVSSFDEDVFEDYRKCMLMLLNEYASKYPQGQENFVDSLSIDEKIRLASIFWVLEVCRSEQMTEEKYKKILRYLESKHFLSYIDAVNKEVKKGKRTHIYYENENFDIENIWKKVFETKGIGNPLVLIYIDENTYKLNKESIISFMKEKNILLVVRAKEDEGFTEEGDMKLLDKQLNLYIKESQDAK